MTCRICSCTQKVFGEHGMRANLLDVDSAVYTGANKQIDGVRTVRVVERRMTQETATRMTAPEGGLLRAWTDALLHPKFETYVRWYPHMDTRWRRTSLAVSLMLILVRNFVQIADSTAHALPASQSLTLDRISVYLASLHGRYELFSYIAGSVAMLAAIPAISAWRANRDIGPYHIRLRVVFGTWMQVQPAVCVLELVSAVAELAQGMSGVSSSHSVVADWVFPLLVLSPALISLDCSCEALAAGSGRYAYRAGLIIVAVAIVVHPLFVVVLPTILRLLGHPVL